MRPSTRLIALGTSVLIAAAALGPTVATAAPFGPIAADRAGLAPAGPDAATSAVVKVGGGHHRRGHWRGRPHRGHGHYRGYPGTAPIVGLGAFALGAAIAANAAAPARACHVERVRQWSPPHNAYIVRNLRVCP